MRCPRWLQSALQWLSGKHIPKALSAVPPPTDRLEMGLTDQQQRLLKVLEQLSDQLTLMYRSSLAIASSPEIPEFEVMAAHQARELMEKLPREVGCAWTTPQGKVEKLKSLMECYEENARSHRRLFSERDPTTVEWPVLFYLAKSDEIFDWHDKHVTAVRENILVLVRHCHATATPSPRTVAAIDRRWRALREFFVGLCHHREAASPTELAERLNELNALLLSLLRPRPVVDFAAIDALIAEGERDGD